MGGWRLVVASTTPGALLVHAQLPKWKKGGEGCDIVGFDGRVMLHCLQALLERGEACHRRGS